MNAWEVEVEIMDGPALIEGRACPRAVLADGTQGVVWRGVTYPLLTGNRIDVAALEGQEQAGRRHVVLPGEEATRVLLQGSAADRAAARRAMEATGVVVLRDGRWLGDPVEGIVFDQFLVCVGALSDTDVPDSLGKPIGGPSPEATVTIALLEQRLADARADLATVEARLRDAVRPLPEVALPSETGVSGSGASQTGASGSGASESGALEAALTEIALVKARLAGVGAPPSTVRLETEFAQILQAFRPELRMLRDGMTVAVGELHDRAGLWKAVSELPQNGSRPTSQWKTLQGLDGWIERICLPGETIRDASTPGSIP